MYNTIYYILYHDECMPVPLSRVLDAHSPNSQSQQPPQTLIHIILKIFPMYTAENNSSNLSNSFHEMEKLCRNVHNCCYETSNCE